LLQRGGQATRQLRQPFKHGFNIKSNQTTSVNNARARAKQVYTYRFAFARKTRKLEGR
jgi:hypothetical protein